MKNSSNIAWTLRIVALIFIGIGSFYIGQTIYNTPDHTSPNTSAVDPSKSKIQYSKTTPPSIDELNDNIEIDYEWIKAPFKNRIIIDGILTSNSTKFHFRDIKVKIALLSKTRSLIGELEGTVYDYLAPRGTVSFKFKRDLEGIHKSEVDRIQLSLISANKTE